AGRAGKDAAGESAVGEVPFEPPQVSGEEGGGRARIGRAAEVGQDARQHPEVGAAGEIEVGAGAAEELGGRLLQGTETGTPGVDQGAVDVEKPQPGGHRDQLPVVPVGASSSAASSRDSSSTISSSPESSPSSS